MNIAVQVEPASGKLPEVEYRWDPDTDILTATLRAGAVGEGMSGSLELTGSDGAWVVLDVAKGGIGGVEVAVWPHVRKLGSLQPPATVEDARVVVPARRSQPGVAAVEVNGALIAEADHAETTIHFKVGGAGQCRTVRIARDVMLDIDPRNRIGGLWLLNVPPFPADQDDDTDELGGDAP